MLTAASCSLPASSSVPRMPRQPLATSRRLPLSGMDSGEIKSFSMPCWFSGSPSISMSEAFHCFSHQAAEASFRVSYSVRASSCFASAVRRAMVCFSASVRAVHRVTTRVTVRACPGSRVKHSSRAGMPSAEASRVSVRPWKTAPAHTCWRVSFVSARISARASPAAADSGRNMGLPTETWGQVKSSPSRSVSTGLPFAARRVSFWPTSCSCSIEVKRSKQISTAVCSSMCQTKRRVSTPVRRSSSRRKSEKRHFARSSTCSPLLMRVYTQSTVLTMNSVKGSIPL